MPKKLPSFSLKVKAIVKTIQQGKTLSYKDVATLAGNPKAARAVAMIMKQNFDPEIPCHRVVRSDGEVGGYNRGGPVEKSRLLNSEGAKHKT